MRRFVNINGILGVLEDKGFNELAIICNGIPGNRVDGRRMMVRIAERLKCSSLRFDILGTGLSNGDITQLNYKTWGYQIDYLINYYSKNFEQIDLICFSESSKILTCIDLSSVRKLLIVNGILSEEHIHGPYPMRLIKDIDNRWLVYNGFGVNLNLRILNYNYIELQHLILSLVNKAIFIYGESDDLTINSKKFLNKNNVKYKKIIGGDHLFTNAKQVDKLIKLIGEVFDNEARSLS